MSGSAPTIERNAPAPTRVEPDRPSSRLHRVGKSQFLWIVVWLAILEFFLISVRPLQYIELAGHPFIDHDVIAFKLDKMRAPLTGYDTLLLGSSSLVAISRIDALEQGIPWRKCDYRTRFDAFDRMFGCSSFNCGMAGSMVSDMERIVGLSLKSGRKPKSVFVFLVPYSLIANTAPAIEHNLIDEYESKKDLMRIIDGALAKNEVGECGKALLGSFWRLFETRSDYCDLGSTLVCSILARSLDHYSATTLPTLSDVRFLDQSIVEKIGEGRPSEKVARAQHQYYRQSFVPLSESRLEYELASLRRLAYLCKANGIAINIVNCPIQESHRELISIDLDGRVEEVCRTLPVRYLDFSNAGFAPADFLDEVHLAPEGGWKLLRKLFSALGGPSGEPVAR